jgi:thioredoxin 1
MKPGMKVFTIVILLVAIGAVAAIRQKRGARECGSTCSRAPGPGATRPAEASPLPRVVDIGAGTCVQCKRMAALLDAFAREFAGRVEVEMIDIRTDDELARLYSYRLIPTQILFDATGKELFRHEGFLSREDILAAFQENGVDLAAASGATTRPGA